MDLFTLICMIIIFIALIINATTEDRYMLHYSEYDEFDKEDFN